MAHLVESSPYSDDVPVVVLLDGDLHPAPRFSSADKVLDVVRPAEELRGRRQADAEGAHDGALPAAVRPDDEVEPRPRREPAVGVRHEVVEDDAADAAASELRSLRDRPMVLRSDPRALPRHQSHPARSRNARGRKVVSPLLTFGARSKFCSFSRERLAESSGGNFEGSPAGKIHFATCCETSEHVG